MVHSFSFTVHKSVEGRRASAMQLPLCPSVSSCPLGLKWFRDEKQQKVEEKIASLDKSDSGSSGRDVTPACAADSSGTPPPARFPEWAAHNPAGNAHWSGRRSTPAVWQTSAPPEKKNKYSWNWMSALLVLCIHKLSDKTLIKSQYLGSSIVLTGYRLGVISVNLHSLDSAVVSTVTWTSAKLFEKAKCVVRTL